MTQNRDQQLARLKTVLQLYGADSDRWLGAERQGLLELVSTDSQAKRMFEDCKALEDCLDAAAETVGAKALSGLASRIMAQAAMASQEHRAQEKESIPDKPFTRSVLAGLSWLKSLGGDGGQFAGRHMASLSLLAACLVLGVLIGMNESLGNYFQQEFQLAFFDGMPGSNPSFEDVLLGTEIL